MLNKKNTLLISGIYALFFVSLFLIGLVCDARWCRVRDDSLLGWTFFLFLPLLPAFLLSLITYRMRQEVFEHWMKFAVWATPTLIVLTFLILQSESSDMGIGGVYSKAFNAFLFAILYGLYTIISLWRIIAKHRTLKR